MCQRLVVADIVGSRTAKDLAEQCIKGIYRQHSAKNFLKMIVLKSSSWFAPARPAPCSKPVACPVSSLLSGTKLDSRTLWKLLIKPPFQAVLNKERFLTDAKSPAYHLSRDNINLIHKDTLHSAMSVVSRLCAKMDPADECLSSCVECLRYIQIEKRFWTCVTKRFALLFQLAAQERRGRRSGGWRSTLLRLLGWQVNWRKTFLKSYL